MKNKVTDIKGNACLAPAQPLSIHELEKSYTGKRKFNAKQEGYSFDLFCNTWLLDMNQTFELDVLADSGLPGETELMVRRLLAIRATTVSASTFENGFHGIKHFFPVMNDFTAFQQVYRQASNCRKNNLLNLFSPVKNLHLKDAKAVTTYFSDITELTTGFTGTQRSMADVIADPEKGSYTDEEFRTLAEFIRTETLRIVTLCQSEPRKLVGKSAGIAISQFSRVVMLHLMLALVRRPTQLVQLKWADILPVGVSFNEHEATREGGIVIEEQMFSDVEQLHVRTFRGKEGLFRQNVERRSHRIEPDLSDMIMLYRTKYQLAFEENLAEQGIQLNKAEWTEIMLRSPIAISDKFFFIKFETKAKLFKALGRQSKSLHITSESLMNRFKLIFENQDLFSERTSNLKLSNNRLRHTVLTNGAIEGLTREQLASITGVTADAVTAYLDLDMTARVKIDSAFAEQKIYKQFDSIGVADLQQNNNFRVLNEFEEEQGVITKPQDCSSCKAATGKPMGCYGCSGFRPFLEADHRANLVKAERKLALNESATPNVLKPLIRAITYIKATITVCDELLCLKKGMSHET
ncbi:MAG: hypothetical protein CBB67_015130 [Alteromonadaceae bacterium TMED7]|nr:MAG: hypothetical protein CBB67_015130 [Alteromonadaceae bacterium TMED7]|tara:strand:- start:5116 stop:6852 length:1737 start_codon:yes stop_codon:yes gene_type:complete